MKKEKAIIIKLDEKTHNEYRELCKKNGFNMSQRLRNFIEKEMNELKSKEI